MDAHFLFTDRPAATTAWEDDSDTAWAEFQMLAGESPTPRTGPSASGFAAADKPSTQGRIHPA